VLICVIHISINAQNKLTLEEAINLAVENNFDLLKEEAIIQNSELNLDVSVQLPNPVFSYSREDLNNSSFNYREWVAAGSIPLNFLWDRWSNIESKEKIIEAQKLFYTYRKQALISKVREVYSAFNMYQNLSQDLNTTVTKLSELAETAKQRVKAGDISEYELQRILIELIKLKSTVSETELQKRSYENDLKLLIGYEIETKITTEQFVLNTEFNLTKEELINLAIQNRGDLKATSLHIESKNVALSNNKLKGIPNINLTAGYKEQDEDFKGIIFQVDFEIPLFDRNQLGIQQSEIDLSILEKEKIFLIEKIKAEVSEAYERYIAKKSLYLDQSDLQLQNLFNTAAYSYEQGEISLVEFIDGINAHTSALILASQQIINLNQSIYELEKYSAVLLTSFKENN
jgi:cobalt-zinc-cadmium resistance protein CzcA